VKRPFKKTIVSIRAIANESIILANIGITLSYNNTNTSDPASQLIIIPTICEIVLIFIAIITTLIILLYFSWKKYKNN
jgi:hypothetical protein